MPNNGEDPCVRVRLAVAAVAKTDGVDKSGLIAVVEDAADADATEAEPELEPDAKAGEVPTTGVTGNLGANTTEALDAVPNGNANGGVSGDPEPTLTTFGCDAAVAGAVPPSLRVLAETRGRAKLIA